MADRLAGKVAIVTGAGSRAAGIGNGRAAAILFAREGARVLVVDRSRAAAEATLKMILGEGGEAAVFDADVTRSDDCAAMVDDAVRRWGRLDILDNNVGIGGRGTVGEVSEEDWERGMCVKGTGWDVGYAALFLVSDEARYITGVVLPVDGGVTIASPSR